LTGGGFFAHTIASDLPFLLDWSDQAKAMIICPEYALLPEHTFPVALNEISRVYKALMNGSASPQLGFEVDRIIVTGESAGGNLAAALCVKLGMERSSDIEGVLQDREQQHESVSSTAASAASSPTGEMDNEFHSFEYHNGSMESFSNSCAAVPLPSALLLSCPALNLSLDLSPSRVIGNEDPVLPSGLISAISNAYLPPQVGIGKQDPLASPLYASDEILRQFPSTLIYGSSDDPLLDDSVAFNKRLKCVGVASELRATHHLPHAYWGLGTAGCFPEAEQVQRECQEFLIEKFEER